MQLADHLAVGAGLDRSAVDLSMAVVRARRAGPTLPEVSTDSAPPRVRTYNARRGRRSPLTVDRIARLLPRREVPDGVLGQGALGRSAPLVVEVGCGHGAAALAYAASHPGHDLVAVDVHTAGVARMLAAADDEGLPNLWAHHGDAVAFLQDRIAVGALRAVHLFFPDPWPKPRHAKRRFLAGSTLDLVAARLQPGGRLLVATDDAVHAEHALTELAGHGAYVVTVAERPPWRPRDGFEQKAIDAGRTVTEIAATVR